MQKQDVPTKYIVRNPNRINAGTFIFRSEHIEYMEGDEFVPSSTVNQDTLKFWVDGRYIEEVTNG